MTSQPTQDSRPHTFPCEGCGAELEFHIGQQRLVCPHCGFAKELALDPERRVAEQDLEAMLQRQARTETAVLPEQREYTCASCAATIRFSGALTSTECSYCGAAVVDAQVHQAEERIAVDGLLPFQVEHAAAQESLRKWVRSRWFAPNEFKRRGVAGRFNGVFFPYWTFDAMTASSYEGERGRYYYVTVGSGKNKRRERRVSWSPASGQFERFFDDVLVCAASSVPPKLMRALEPWPLERVRPFDPQALAGSVAMTYDQELAAGFGAGKERIREELDAEVRRRIGGDTQRVHRIDTAYSALKYKHLLLPVWILAYRFRDKPYQIVVNACTGEVQGERPYSWVKIALAVFLPMVIMALITIIGMLVTQP